MQFGGFWVHLHDSFTLMDCQRGVTRHRDNPPSDAYAETFLHHMTPTSVSYVQIKSLQEHFYPEFFCSGQT